MCKPTPHPPPTTPHTPHTTHHTHTTHTPHTTPHTPPRCSQSVDYQQYLAQGGRPFSNDIFLQSKCFCIEQTDFQECACPYCTLMRETTRGWHKQRKGWHREHDKEGAPPCSCGKCSKGSKYREASGSLFKLREFVHAPCGMASFPDLAIESGPKSTETFELYRRQCCRAPPPNKEVCIHQRCNGSKGVCDDCGDCGKCGWSIMMPSCPIESGMTAEVHMAITQVEAELAVAAAATAAAAVEALPATAKKEAAQAKAEAATREAEALAVTAAAAAAAAMDAEWKEYRPRIEPDGAAPPLRPPHPPHKRQTHVHQPQHMHHHPTYHPSPPSLRQIVPG